MPVGQTTGARSLELEASHQLTGTRVGTVSSCAGHQVDVTITARQEAGSGVRGARLRIGGGWRRKERSVEHVVEFRADVEIHAFFEAKCPAETNRFSGLPLPAVVVIEGCGGSEGTGGGIGKGRRIQDQSFFGIEAVAVRVDGKERLAGNQVLERAATTPHRRIVRCPAIQLREQAIIGPRNGNQSAALITQYCAQHPIPADPGQRPHAFRIAVQPLRGVVGRNYQQEGSAEPGKILILRVVEYVVDRGSGTATRGAAGRKVRRIGVDAEGQFFLPGERRLHVEAVRVPLGDFGL